MLTKVLPALQKGQREKRKRTGVSRFQFFFGNVGQGR